jgi:uncharacterized membrane protein YozB (DUF420 family)
MADQEKIRVETPEEEEEEEEDQKTGLFRPLPTRDERKYVRIGNRPQPIVKLLGISMPEKRKDLLILILIPALVALIDTTIFSFVVTGQVQNSVAFLFLLPTVAAIPIGLTSSEASNSLGGAFIADLFFLLFLVAFLSYPSFIVPTLGIGSTIVVSIGISIGYFILMILATFLGAIIGIIAHEFF